MKKIFFGLLIILSQIGFAAGDPLQSMRLIPVQDGGRIKPLDTFARETLSLVYGKEKYEGKESIEILMTWLLQPQSWEDKKIFQIRYQLLKKALKLDETKNHFSLQEIMTSERLSYVMQELQSQREAKTKLDPYFQAAQRLESQIGAFRGIARGDNFRIFPPSAENDGHQWMSLAQMASMADITDLQTAFTDLTSAFVKYLEATTNKSVNSQIEEGLSTAVDKLKKIASMRNPSVYPDAQLISREVHYNQFHPFQKAWIFYLLAALSLILIWVIKKEILYKIAWIFSGVGFLFHLYGFALRTLITGRAPVSNMYETVVWVALGAVVFSFIIEAIYKWRFVLLAGTIVGSFCLILSDFSPVVLDPSMQPLVAVLNSNFWLTTHVLTITISYAAFFLAFVLGDIALGFFLKNEAEDSPRIRALTLSIYRAMQIGVGFLAPGIILGGIWADYSWGRFWGWDPKETWALIALLGYVAVLHARIAGLIKNFGMAVSGILTFSLVIMAWYGVNFILGAGLHSYGFGAGGVEYVATFVAAHIIYVVVVSTIRHSSKTKIK